MSKIQDSGSEPVASGSTPAFSEHYLGLYLFGKMFLNQLYGLVACLALMLCLGVPCRSRR